MNRPSSLHILYEDNHLIAVHKPSGQSVQPEDGKPLSLDEEVKQYIKVSKQKPGDVFLGVIHRLDMPVSGIVLFAKTSKALVRMNEQFKQRSVQKIYTAQVTHIPTSKKALLTHYLVRDDSKRMTKAYDKEVPNSQQAQLEYEVIAVQQHTAILKITLFTGRKHQIRAQLSKMGFPIMGDVKYKAPTSLPNGAIALSATYLSFMHPVSKELIEIRSEFQF
jgi:23S rRNA pseudouridine1911/1915/1917 synthase